MFGIDALKPAYIIAFIVIIIIVIIWYMSSSNSIEPMLAELRALQKKILSSMSK